MNTIKPSQSTLNKKFTKILVLSAAASVIFGLSYMVLNSEYLEKRKKQALIVLAGAGLTIFGTYKVAPDAFMRTVTNMISFGRRLLQEPISKSASVPTVPMPTLPIPAALAVTSPPEVPRSTPTLVFALELVKLTEKLLAKLGYRSSLWSVMGNNKPNN